MGAFQNTGRDLSMQVPLIDVVCNLNRLVCTTSSSREERLSQGGESPRASVLIMWGVDSVET